ncbi:F0F1 ATP synthase subunit delta [Conchiformibius kuhniae]|uniref:ATP synthase subunit delta n=1 Tax=Conchiformibius kuhniae TaxID=211502 RepID=A0ABD8B7Y9_9NEIS|nr:F0F1 ATP synthase subunit delta [Conchiformibius kuhniae]
MIEFATVARPYAKALFELAEEKQQTQAWLGGLAQLAWLVRQPQVSALLGRVDTEAAQKADELTALLDCPDAVKSAEFANFVQVLAQEKRLAVLPEIYLQYQNLVLMHNHVKQAVVYTAYDVVSEDQKAKIVSDLEQYFNTRLQATFQTDPELIGGVKVEVGDQVLDLSVQAKLNGLYAAMTN